MQLWVLLVMRQAESVLGIAYVCKSSALLEPVDIIDWLLSLVDQLSNFLRKRRI